VAELVACVGLCQWLGSRRDAVAGENLNAFGAGKKLCIQIEFVSKLHIQVDEAGRSDRRGVDARIKIIRQPRVAVFKGNRRRT
jgi:hypothetical protein